MPKHLSKTKLDYIILCRHCDKDPNTCDCDAPVYKKPIVKRYRCCRCKTTDQNVCDCDARWEEY